ncbi:hypothetical protein KIW84_057165 [Lathyrus oleraceus]|uniref:Uncharacterized protein n=1 Tax=Pisum sativum TaxID=3888 RepID=A0A9D5AMF5_PEA|nr:hypothetical protein KIW84_057165 [Pisum sativum]
MLVVRVVASKKRARPSSSGELKARPSKLWAEEKLSHGRRARFGKLEFVGRDLGVRENVDIFQRLFAAFEPARDLEGNVTGTTKCHPSTIGTGEATSANHTHSLLIRQDKLIYLALLGSGNSKARSVMVATDISHEAWLALTRVFSNQSE